ncbi:hypothetical protein ACWEWI_37770 [Streptomyces sp. NPDC003753]|uniref:hypothetical protein n=1 Tax=Streptomyces sp. Y2F8-2 TaxID=2759675 RepID=UPI0019082253|nr:hypothetical protein [Streptomyces sp. Y2F8-2]
MDTPSPDELRPSGVLIRLHHPSVPLRAPFGKLEPTASQQWRQHILVRLLIPKSCERRRGTQILEHGVLVPGSRAGQLTGTEQPALDG